MAAPKIIVIGGGLAGLSAVIKIAEGELKSSRVVKAGPHGGQMVCGYSSTSGSAEASECVWATKTTVGQVQFLKNATPVKRGGTSGYALKVRDAVEVKG